MINKKYSIGDLIISYLENWNYSHKQEIDCAIYIISALTPRYVTLLTIFPIRPVMTVRINRKYFKDFMSLEGKRHTNHYQAIK